jgi:hypothetical protein
LSCIWKTLKREFIHMHMHRALATTLDRKYVHLQIHVVVDVNCCNSVAIHDEDDLVIFFAAGPAEICWRYENEISRSIDSIDSWIIQIEHESYDSLMTLLQDQSSNAILNAPLPQPKITLVIQSSSLWYAPKVSQAWRLDMISAGLRPANTVENIMEEQLGSRILLV